MTTGDVLVTGGDLTVDGGRNFANNNTNIFSPTTNTLTSNTPMQYPRWYPSLVALPDARLAVFGGYQNNVPPLDDPVIPAATPEINDPATKVWTNLTGAASDAAFGLSEDDWYYPRTYVAPGGNLFVISHDGSLYSVSVAGVGSITQLTQRVPLGLESLPTVNFAPGKVLSIRQSLQAVVVDFTRSVPVITQTDNIDQERYWASGTITADGKVLVTGGSVVSNELTGVAYQAEFGIRRQAIGRPVRGSGSTLVPFQCLFAERCNGVNRGRRGSRSPGQVGTPRSIFLPCRLSGIL